MGPVTLLCQSTLHPTAHICTCPAQMLRSTLTHIFLYWHIARPNQSQEMFLVQICGWNYGDGVEHMKVSPVGNQAIVSISNDHRTSYVITDRGDGNQLFMCDMAVRKERRVWKDDVEQESFPSKNSCIAFSPGGKYIVVCVESSRICIVDIKTGQEHLVSRASATHVAFNYDGTKLAAVVKGRLADVCVTYTVPDEFIDPPQPRSPHTTEDADSTAIEQESLIRSCRAGEAVKSMPGISLACESNDGRWLATATRKGPVSEAHVRVFDTADSTKRSQKLRLLLSDRGEILSLRFSPECSKLLVMSESCFAVLCVHSGKTLWRFSQYCRQPIYPVATAWGPDGSYIVVQLRDCRRKGVVQVRTTDNLRQVVRIRWSPCIEPQDVCLGMMTFTGKRTAAALIQSFYGANKLERWEVGYWRECGGNSSDEEDELDLHRQDPIFIKTLSDFQVNAFSVSRTNCFALATTDGVVTFHHENVTDDVNFPEAILSRFLRGHRCSSVAHGPCGCSIAVVLTDEEDQLLIIEAESGKQISHMASPVKEVTKVSYNASGSQLILHSTGGVYWLKIPDDVAH